MQVVRVNLQHYNSYVIDQAYISVFVEFGEELQQLETSSANQEFRQVMSPEYCSLY